MNIQSIILKNEQEFRKYVINNAKNISNAYVFLDELNNIIYFYLFTTNNTIVAAKENNINYMNYIETYQNLADIYNLNIKIDFNTKKRIIK